MSDIENNLPDDSAAAREKAEATPAPASEAPASLPVELLEEKVRKLSEENRQLMDQLLRVQAEMENQRKRLAREKEEFLQFSLFQAVKSLLPVLDGFELALQNPANGDEYRKGVELIYSQLYGALQRLGLQALEAKGKPFDPNLHEAIATVETDQVPDQQVVDELQRGYLFKSRLLRPAVVRVARQPAPAPSSSEPLPSSE